MHLVMRPEHRHLVQRAVEPVEVIVTAAAMPAMKV
jgi:hypothetical protein